ncbi:hypothetical protein V8B97DRAFT_1386770 [Scleroderma yunnanense]
MGCRDVQSDRGSTYTEMLVILGLGLEKVKNKKRGACPARVAMAGLENIETVHEPKPIQTVGTLWGQGRRAMEGPHGPQTRIHEGACAIKVSMKKQLCPTRVYVRQGRCTDHLCDISSIFPFLEEVLAKSGHPTTQHANAKASNT